MVTDFAGKTALVTGAARGIGGAAALGLADAGATVHERFSQNFAEGTLITPEQSAAALVAYQGGDDTAAIWDVSTARVRS